MRVLEVYSFVSGRFGLTQCTYGEEEITDIMSDEHSQPHIGEMEAIAQENEGQGHNVMANQLMEVFPALLKPQ